MYNDVCCDQGMLDEVTSRQQAAVTLTFQVEQLLKQASSELTDDQTEELETLMDDVRHRLNTVSNYLYFHLSNTHNTPADNRLAETDAVVGPELKYIGSIPRGSELFDNSRYG